MTLLRSAECVIVPGSLCSVLSTMAMMLSRRLVRGFRGDLGAPLEAT